MRTSIGLPENVEVTLSYILGLVTGIIFLIFEKDSEFVRFHAMQSVVAFGGLVVLKIVLGIFILPLALLIPPVIFLASLFSGLINLTAFVIWILCMYKAYMGEWYKLPIAGEIAENLLH